MDEQMSKIDSSNKYNLEEVVKSHDDIADLKIADYQMPDTDKEKNLRACMGCRLVMSESQWRKKKCVNCPANENPMQTPFFSGMVSLFMPNSSWVAKWNDLKGVKPGIYAINILEDTMEGEYVDDYPDEHIKQKRQRRTNRNEDDWSDPDDDYLL